MTSNNSISIEGKDEFEAWLKMELERKDHHSNWTMMIIEETLAQYRSFRASLLEKIENLDTRSEESDSFDTGHHLAIREVLELMGGAK